MKVVVTGPSGFIAGAFIRSVLTTLASGPNKPGLVLLTSDAPRSRDLVTRYPGAQVFPLRDEEGHVNAEAMRGAEVLLHLGWSTVPSTAGMDPVMGIRTDLGGGMELLRASTLAGVRRIVFLSSGGTVYGRALDLPIREDHPVAPVEPYGIAKLAFEGYLAWWCAREGLAHLILRPGNVYGSIKGQHKPQGVVDHWLNCLKHDRPVEVWHGLEVVRDLIHVDDMVEVLHRAVRYTGPERVLNVGTGQGTSLGRLQEVIAEVTGRQLRVVDRAAGPPVVPANVLDGTRLQHALGDLRFRTVEEGVADMWRAMQA